MGNRIGNNINGPSVISVPEWVENPLGAYYMYFAHHSGDFIRLAWADDLEGPWSIHEPGVLHISEAGFNDHIASPDVHVDDAQREIRMYFHGCCVRLAPSHLGGSKAIQRLKRLAARYVGSGPSQQFTRLATSSDGLSFRASTALIGWSYWRAFYYKGWWYTLEMPGQVRRSVDGKTGFESGPRILPNNTRHSAVFVEDSVLHILFSRIGDTPERILHTTLDLTPDWMRWKTEVIREVIEPQETYEGSELELKPSTSGAAPGPTRALRDPCVFQEDGRTYLFYSTAGESGIAMAELHLP